MISNKMSVFGDLQVFSDVSATVSEEFWHQVPDCKLEILKKLKVDTNINYKENPNTKLCIIQGNMQQLLNVQKYMISYLKRLATAASFTNFGTDFHLIADDVCSSTVSSAQFNSTNIETRFEDKAVMCDLLKENYPHVNQFINNNSSTAAALTVMKKYKTRKKKSIRRNAALITKNENKQKCLQIKRNSLLMGNDLDFNVEVNKIEDSFKMNLSNKQESLLNTNALVYDAQQVDDEINEKYITGRKTEHSKSFKFSCKQCSFKSNRESHLMKHTRIHEKVNTLYNCDKCNFTTIRLSHLRRHTITHSQVVYNCDFCSYKSNDVKLLARHVKVKHANDNKLKIPPDEVLICSYCSYKTTKSYFYQRHLRAHCADKKQANIVAYQCDKCDYKTNRREHYMRHISDVHMNRRPFLCDFCGKAFKRPDALKQHKQTHGEPAVEDFPNSSYNCNICQKKCRSHFSLREHLAVHSNERSFLCEICGASFKTRSVQRKHVITIHKNPRSYLCHLCERRFNTNYALRRHLRLHTKNNDDLQVEDQSTMANDVTSIVQLGEIQENCGTTDENDIEVEEYLIDENNDDAILNEIIEDEMNQIEIKLNDVDSGLDSTSQNEIEKTSNTLLYIPNGICDIVLA